MRLLFLEQVNELLRHVDMLLVDTTQVEHHEVSGN